MITSINLLRVLLIKTISRVWSDDNVKHRPRLVYVLVVLDAVSAL